MEQIVGAEMTRRTFTNCCNIMNRHDFTGKWRAWQAGRSGGRCGGKDGLAEGKKSK
jgi:hypothetical protein